MIRLLDSHFPEALVHWRQARDPATRTADYRLFEFYSLLFLLFRRGTVPRLKPMRRLLFSASAQT
jgi:hypothetical protein